MKQWQERWIKTTKAAWIRRLLSKVARWSNRMNRIPLSFQTYTGTHETWQLPSVSFKNEKIIDWGFTSRMKECDLRVSSRGRPNKMMLNNSSADQWQDSWRTLIRSKSCQQRQIITSTDFWKQLIPTILTSKDDERERQIHNRSVQYLAHGYRLEDSEEYTIMYCNRIYDCSQFVI